MDTARRRERQKDASRASLVHGSSTRGARALVVSLFVLGLHAGCSTGCGTWRAAATDDMSACTSFDHTYVTWSALVDKHVTAGVVDYTAIARESRALLDESVRALESVCTRDYDGWSRDERLAYWVNAYNIYTVRLIVENMPISSIQDLGIVKHTVWFRDVTAATPLHKPLSLDAIEHQILRKEFEEPRIHFAIVCASQSCPRLVSTAYVPARLDEMLDDAARAFIRDETKNRYDANTHTMHLSSIFSWFEGDFTTGGRTLVEFVAPHLDEAVRAAVTQTTPRVAFLDYDWSLNGH
jgi:hypothetical protein